MDTGQVAGHLQSVIDREGRVDVSFNAVGVPDATILGVPLTEMDAGQFALAIASYTTSYFLTARLAARHMAAKEALTRDLSAELAPRGIRVVGLRPHGMPETTTMKEAFDVKASGMSWDQFQQYLASTTHPRRVMKLEEVANMAVFMASDRASGMTGTTVNLTMGSLDD
jgi:NAD(P)-dependent dehydrogenase (short-subunit alcohol dehydrogenase family)